MLDLKNVTLVTVDGVDPEKAMRALKYSSREINFGKIRMISFRKPENISENTEFIQIEKLTNPGYNRFIAMDLYNFIDTDFCIIVQPDGFLLNANQWTDDFLNYDYIGAPWPADFMDLVLIHKYKRPAQGKPIVGNGGFTLRSRKILQAASKYNWPGGPEDNFFCFDIREQLESQGIKFAPVDTALHFALECPLVEGTDRHLLPIDWSKHFGFHGLYPYLWKLLEKES